ncbi:MAG: hypothetical protein M5R40_29405 [Anaerolineae bacterium]|nr:hypothetical protein [Anaerolineae bacterium]
MPLATCGPGVASVLLALPNIIGWHVCSIIGLSQLPVTAPHPGLHDAGVDGAGLQVSTAHEHPFLACGGIGIAAVGLLVQRVGCVVGPAVNRRCGCRLPRCRALGTVLRSAAQLVAVADRGSDHLMMLFGLAFFCRAMNETWPA